LPFSRSSAACGARPSPHEPLLAATTPCSARAPSPATGHRRGSVPVACSSCGILRFFMCLPSFRGIFRAHSPAGSSRDSRRNRPGFACMQVASSSEMADATDTTEVVASICANGITRIRVGVCGRCRHATSAWMMTRCLSARDAAAGARWGMSTSPARLLLLLRLATSLAGCRGTSAPYAT
jgi:hypothetical protein